MNGAMSAFGGEENQSPGKTGQHSFSLGRRGPTEMEEEADGGEDPAPAAPVASVAPVEDTATKQKGGEETDTPRKKRKPKSTGAKLVSGKPNSSTRSGVSVPGKY